MADKSFGVKELNILGSGTPSIDSQGDLNLNANKVAISTDFTVGGASTVTGNSFVGSAISMYAATGIVSATKFCGDGSGLTNAGGFTPDAQQNLYAGTNAGADSDADTCFNVAIGYSAGASNCAGDHNVFIGSYTGCKITNSGYNVAIGFSALTCSSGNSNIAMGYHAGMKIQGGHSNVLLGSMAGCSITSGGENVMIGRFAGKFSAGGNGNFFGGYGAGCCNLTGTHNVALGNRALVMNGSGSKDSSYNIALGFNALREIVSGGCNFAVGREAGVALSDGVDNILIGRCADASGGSQNRLIMIGWKVRACNSTGSDQLAIGCDTCRWLQGDSSFNLCLGGGQAIKAMANGNFCATAFYGDGSNLTGISGGGSGGCLKLIATSNLVSDGLCAGCNLSGATDNILLGCGAGCNLTCGDNNIMMGNLAGKCHICSCGNVFLGACAGCYTNGNYGCSVMIGHEAGKTNVFPQMNIYIGYRAGMRSWTSTCNILIGSNIAACNQKNGKFTIAIGHEAIRCSCDGTYSDTSVEGSVWIGYRVGYGATEAHSNTVIGCCAGYALTCGSRNVFLGAGAGKNITTGGCNVLLGKDVEGGSATGDKQFKIGCAGSHWICGDSSFNIYDKDGNQLNGGGGGGSGGCLKIVETNNLVADGFCSGCNLTNASGFNIFMMCCAGKSMTSGTGNIIFGQQAGCHFVASSNNIIIGCKAGRSFCHTNSNENIYLGTYAGGSDGCNASCQACYNIGIGYQAACCAGKVGNVAIGYKANCGGTSAGCNVSIGYCAGTNPGGGGNCNIAIGRRAGQCTYGSDNVFIGNQTGPGYDNMTQNTMVGNCAGCQTNGDKNQFFGTLVAGTNTSGCCNVAIGYDIDLASATGNCQFIIGVAGSHWICGDSSFNIYDKDGNQLNGGGGGSGGCLKIVESNNFVSDGACAGCNITSSGDHNIAIGFCAGRCITQGDDNVIIGQQAGNCLVCGSMNVFIGKCAGYGTTISGCSGGGCNVIIGMGAGKCGNDGNFSANVFIGCEAARTACYNSITAIGSRSAYSLPGTNGWMNTVVGACAGYCSASGQTNTFVGSRAGKFNASGSNNVFLGFEAMGESDAGDHNTVLGVRAGRCITGGESGNTFVGKYAARCSTQGSNNVAIGCDIQLPSATGDNQMAIGIGANKWIYGDSSYNIYDKDGNQLNGGGGSGGCLKLVGTRNYVSDGSCSGCNLASGTDNIFLGACSGKDADTDTCFNVGIGYEALCAVNEGDNNIAIGPQAGKKTTSGYGLVAMGCVAACNNTTGNANIALGYYSLRMNSTGSCNLVIGWSAGQNVTGHWSTFLGTAAGKYATTVKHSIGIGCGALAGTNSTANSGCYNVAFGLDTGTKMSTGHTNVFLGRGAGCNNTTGSENIAIGCKAQATGTLTGQQNITIGKNAGTDITSGSYNILFGRQAAAGMTTGASNIAMGTGTLGGDLAATTTGHGNVTIGNLTAVGATSACCNVIIGHVAGRCVTEGDENVFLGRYAGKTTSTGSNNIMIGSMVCASSATASTEMRIGCGSNYWLSGDSSYNVVIGGCVQATSAASSANGHRKITTSTSAPSGGSDGDIWIKYTA